MTLKPLKIGSLTVDIPVALAPMAGYTDSSLRAICKSFHCGLAFTEVVNAEGIIHGSQRTRHPLETDPAERPVGAHIYGSNPAVMAEAAATIQGLGRFDLIDVNCGCPVRKIVAKGSGVALMKNPDKIGAIVRAICDAVSLPVTVKTRIGVSSDRMNISEVAQAAEEGGAAAITIHGRFAQHQHRGVADWDTLAQIKTERSIPVLGNGGINRACDALTMFERTGVDGVMVGRAAVGNPWIFEEIYCLLSGAVYTPHSLEEHRAVIADQLARLVALKELERRYRRKKSMAPEQSAALHFRAQLLKYLAGFEGSGEVRRSLDTMCSTTEMLATVDRVLAANKGDPR